MSKEIQLKYQAMLTLKERLLKKWLRKRTMSLLEFRVFVSEVVELVLADMLTQELYDEEMKRRMRTG